MKGLEVRRLRFGPVDIDADASVLEPRPWTLGQSTWAAELAAGAPPGPMLELCCGAGQIGLAAARLSGRAIVQIDRDARACAWARHNARRHGIVADVRHAPLDAALRADERFAVIVADPPYLRSAEVPRYPDDPVLAIDGGADGLELAGQCIVLASRHARPGAPVLLQVRGPAQAEAVATLTATLGVRLVPERVRTWSAERAVVLLRARDGAQGFLHRRGG